MNFIFNSITKWDKHYFKDVQGYNVLQDRASVTTKWSSFLHSKAGQVTLQDRTSITMWGNY